MQNTIINLLHNGAADAPAIVAPDTEPLNYATFKLHVTKVVGALKIFGVGRGDRVAIVLPNGPHMASAFVSIAAGATAAPLNPSYRADEFSFFLDDHDDHRCVNHLLLEVLKEKPLPKCEIWAYQVYSTVIPNVAVNITGQIERKKELIHIWKSVGKFNDLAHYILGINASNCRYIVADEPIWVETFFTVPIEEYLELCELYFLKDKSKKYYFDYYNKE